MFKKFSIGLAFIGALMFAGSNVISVSAEEKKEEVKKKVGEKKEEVKEKIEEKK
ncbi:MAG: hypothetical protein UZ01_02560 [Candidatus Brocadia sinica]|uniref:N5,N10-methylene tetrahydromethanopterin reductase and related flavin-dependent oxidoreductases n=1 Tax=Candidatus Brocadia sinica JPN1 TaxID=1197129 RepID=A0ABQ0K0Q4_9BACT|nr:MULTISPECIES: hypothetical protein [Brocadia]KXK28815.1 MAG: hypothetical protein UZ01_02560 [Candidatus Brocadia sinica]NOG42458.1 hypothetical protein [Planctomycetota bacterium]GAN34655.1 N5,N10-methylene tetrahydromethanopterin reductase and related flavin-dependent oxidoreductases [Candidatus Brocadia sinica JPN1]GIK11679.1 MAG: hypothetical protein BroJett002_03860 [Candidatus Brocadia sinica]GJQ19209.1 MAG: hypothetical protein HBSIN01_31680 [Candidatus Brocadia sinica]